MKVLFSSSRRVAVPPLRLQARGGRRHVRLFVLHAALAARRRPRLRLVFLPPVGHGRLPRRRLPRPARSVVRSEFSRQSLHSTG